MFNKNFYPTPENIIKKMLEPFTGEFGELQLGDKKVLEPSAGKGDILDYLSKKSYTYGFKTFAIENNPELQWILQSKNHKLIDSDFLNFSPEFSFDLIIMNPPFDRGVDHLLKAWEILQNGDIVCLLNAETIKNPYSKKRELLKKIIEENGSAEFLGDCFAEAERKTGVEVALVRLKKKTEKREFEFNFNDFENVDLRNEDYEDNSPAIRDFIDNICVQYEQIKKDFKELLKIKSKINHYSKNITRQNSGLERDFDLEGGEAEFFSFVKNLKNEIWRYIAEKANIERFMTTKVKMNFNDFLNQQSNLAITKKNILDFISVIWQTRGQNIENAIIDCFDEFTKFHKENRYHVEGWKTNDRFKVNMKVILPYKISYGSYMTSNDLKEYGDRFKVDGYNAILNDIDKALCFISGKEYGKIRKISEALRIKFDFLGTIYTGDKYDNTCESEFFEITFFKKGTLHLKFKDEWVWKEFNMRACARKKWLPEAEKKEWEESKKKEEKEEKNILMLEAENKKAEEKSLIEKEFDGVDPAQLILFN